MDVRGDDFLCDAKKPNVKRKRMGFTFTLIIGMMLYFLGIRLLAEVKSGGYWLLSWSRGGCQPFSSHFTS